MDCRFVYMTCSTAEEARLIGRALVQEHIAACVNILGEIESIYEWQGELCEECEVAMIAKTTATRMPALIVRVKELHSYDCPCIIGLPIGEGHQPYLDWLSESCS
ncbi:MAG: divalent-cation tolerance protein CutA [Lentisphaeria bacterium]